MKPSRKECGCKNCQVCEGKGRTWNEKASDWDYCKACKGRGASAFCFEDAKRLNMLDAEDIKRHSQYVRKQAA